MKSVWKNLVHCSAMVGASVILSGFVAAQDSGAVGIVRIAAQPGARDAGNGSSANGPVRPVNAMMMQNCAPSSAPGAMSAPSAAACPDPASAGLGAAGAPNYSGCPTPNGFGAGAYSNSCPPGYGGHPRCGNPNGEALMEYLKCKFGYFIPTGGGGKGIPWVGRYSRVYPVDPYYRDGRDGQMWAAQGYGVPMAVPLAPVVGHTYDYSWGVPSSRLTPISNPAY